MKTIFMAFLLLTTFGCQKASEQEIDTFFERLSVLVTKSNTINMNIQNAQTTRTAQGGAYIPKQASSCRSGTCKIVPLSCKGVGCPPDGKAIVSPVLKYDSKHPDANADGYVAYPNLNVQEEMSKLIRVQRAIDYLMDSIPVTKSYFYSDAIQKYFKKYPALNHDYNFEKLLRE
jgi:flagellar basal-body rod protein FlgC